MTIKEKKEKYVQGKFKPANPKKYVGKVDEICYRSGWEFSYMMKLDHDPDVISWSSEELSIPYKSPVDKRMHRYFPDFIVRRKDRKVYIIEIKPAVQTRVPKQSKNRKKMLNESATYAINQAKWKAAEEFCHRNGFIFQILTEKELKIK